MGSVSGTVPPANERAGPPLRVCIDARVGEDQGGVQQVVLGLAAGLGALRDGGEEYLFLCRKGGGDWLRPYLGPNSRLLGDVRTPLQSARRALRKAANAAARLGDDPAWRRPGLGPPHRSDGLAESAGARVMCFALQGAFLTRLPSIYYPHDLQHLHLPELFTRLEWERRERNYRLFCERARFVVAASSWVKEDLVRQYRLPPAKVVLVESAPPIAAYPEPTADDLARVRARLRLEGPFLFYPAQTWAHKNHAVLFEALARLRDEGLVVPFVSAGHLNDHYPALAARARALGLEGQVRFLGFVAPLEIQVLYRSCTAVVIPTLFEQSSLPLWEAMLAGAPAACSDVTSLPRQAGDAALVFDPRDPASVAAAVRRLWTDEALRRDLAGRGRRRVALFTLDRAARKFRALFRALGGTATPGDRELLAAEPLL